MHALQAIKMGDLSREMVVSEPLQLDLDNLPEDDLDALMRAAFHLSEVQVALDEAFVQMTQSLRLAREQKIICLADVPPGYLPVGSALGGLRRRSSAPSPCCMATVWSG